MKTVALLALTLCASCYPFLGQQPANGGGGGYSSSPSSGSYASSPSSSSSSSSSGYSSSSSAAPAAAAPAGPVSVTIRSACGKTVKVFFGDKPKFGSGTYSSVESNSVQSHSFRAGEQLWIVDESENGLGNAQIGPGTRELEIDSGCTTISAR